MKMQQAHDEPDCRTAITTPCKQCPFRKKSPAGWLGEHQAPEEITNIVLADERFPCHMDVTKRTEDGEDFERAVWTAGICAGSAAMLNNMLKRSRQPEVSRVQSVVGKREDVFARPADMHAHHNSFLHRKRK